MAPPANAPGQTQARNEAVQTVAVQLDKHRLEQESLAGEIAALNGQSRLRQERRVRGQQAAAEESKLRKSSSEQEFLARNVEAMMMAGSLDAANAMLSSSEREQKARRQLHVARAETLAKGGADGAFGVDGGGDDTVEEELRTLAAAKDALDEEIHLRTLEANEMEAQVLTP